MYLDRQLEEVRASGDGREAQDSDSLRRLYNAAIQAVGRCGQWRVAVSMLYAMDAKHGLAPDAFSYGNAINACVQARRPRVARRLLADMRARGVPRNVVVYTMAMKALGDEPDSDARDVLLLLEEMERDDVAPNCWAVTAAITVCALRADWQAAVALLRDMPLKYGVEPSEETWHAAIHACDRGMAWQQALTLLREMPEPTVTAYNSAMSACSRAGNWQEALVLVSELRQRGMVPDLITYNTIITALGRGGQWCEALDVLDGLPAPLAPNVHTFNAALAACAAARQWDPAMELFHAMARRGVVDVVSFNTAISVLARMRQGQRAVALFEEMQAAGIRPDAVTFGALALACERSAPPLHRRASGLLREMREAGVAPTNATFASVISTVGRVGADQAITLLNHMEALGTPPNAICLQAALTACERANSNNSADCALDVFARMRARFGGGGDGGGARGADAEWTKRGPAAYATAIRACQKNGRWRDACALLGEMRAEPWCTSDYDQWYSALALLAGDVPDPSRPVPTLKTYLAAMAGAASAGRWEETLALLGGMEVQGLQPGAVGYGAALEALATAGEHERGLALFEQTRGKAGFTPDVLCFTAALSCCHGVGDWQRALVYMREATEAGLLPTRRMRLLAARTCRVAERHDELWGLYADMQMGSSGGGGSSSGGGGGDVAFLTEVLEGCGAARRADRVVELLYKQQSLCDDRALTLAALEALAAAAAAPAAADAVLARAVAHGALRDPCLTLPAVDLAGLGPGAAAAVARHAACAAAAAAPQTGAGLTLVGARGGGAALAAGAQELERLGLAPQLARRRGGGSSAHVAAAALASWAAAAAAGEAAAEAELPGTDGATDAKR